MLSLAVLLQRLAWRTDSCLDCQGPAGEDLSGGYYEAGGSYLKFSFPTAYTFTQLAWGVVEFRDGYSKVSALVIWPCMPAIVTPPMLYAITEMLNLEHLSNVMSEVCFCLGR